MEVPNNPINQSNQSVTQSTPQNSARQNGVGIKNIKLVNNALVAWNNLLTLQKFRRLLIGIISFFVLFIIMIVLLAIAKNAQRNKVPAPTPSPTPFALGTPMPELITNPSRYATDSGVLKIEQDLKNLDNDLNTTDLKEPQLQLPRVSYDVSF